MRPQALVPARWVQAMWLGCGDFRRRKQPSKRTGGAEPSPEKRRGWVPVWKVLAGLLQPGAAPCR